MSETLFSACTGQGSLSLKHQPDPEIIEEAKFEAARRAHNRRIAQAFMVRLEDPDDPRPPGQEGPEWIWGVCTRCRTDDLVKGPPGAELCIYCDELRIAPPPPAPPAARPVQLGRPPVLGLAGVICMSAYILTGVVDLFWMGLGMLAICMITGR
jgi:hypothetical protein